MIKNSAICILGTLFSLLLGANCGFALNKLELKAYVNKAVFLEGEPVWLTIQLNSKSGSPLPIYGNCGSCGDITTVLKNSKGQEILNRGPIANRGSAPRKPLITTKSLVDMENILTFHGYSEAASPSILFLPADTYTIEVRADERAILNDGTNPSMLRTNVVTFKVVAPEGDEKKARQLYLDAIQPRNDKTKSVAITKFSAIINDFPRSVYVARAVHYLQMIYHVDLHEREKSKEIIRAFMNKYPDDPYNYIAVAKIAGGQGSLLKKRSFCDSLIQVRPNSFQAKVATQYKEMYAKERTED